MKFPLFLLIGDPFLSREKAKEIIASLQKEWGPDLAVTFSRAGDEPVESLLAQARTLPFLAPAQVFCLSGAERFTKSDLTLWQTYFQSPHPQSIFLFEAEALEKGHPFLEGAAKARQLFLLRPDARKLVTHFVQEKLREARKKITQDALALLESRLGDSFLFLDSVLDQLILAAAERPEIDRVAVEALEEKWKQFGGFDLARALSERNFPRCLEILEELLEVSGQDVASLVGPLHWQLRRLWETKKSPVVEKALEGLFYLDWHLKTGRALGRTELESWLVSATS